MLAFWAGGAASHTGVVPPTPTPSDPGGRIVAHRFTRKRFDELLAAIRDAEERAQELKVKDRAKVEKAIEAAKEVAEVVDHGVDVSKLTRALEAAASAQSTVKTIRMANQALAAAKLALEEDEEEEALMLLMLH